LESVKNLEGDILTETAAYLSAILGPEMDALKVERAVIGIFFTGVKLSNGEGGICQRKSPLRSKRKREWRSSSPSYTQRPVSFEQMTNTYRYVFHLLS
jgi:hypothetical protein